MQICIKQPKGFCVFQRRSRRSYLTSTFTLNLRLKKSLINTLPSAYTNSRYFPGVFRLLVSLQIALSARLFLRYCPKAPDCHSSLVLCVYSVSIRGAMKNIMCASLSCVSRRPMMLSLTGMSVDSSSVTNESVETALTMEPMNALL